MTSSFKNEKSVDKNKQKFYNYFGDMYGTTNITCRCK